MFGKSTKPGFNIIKVIKSRCLSRAFFAVLAILITLFGHAQQLDFDTSFAGPDGPVKRPGTKLDDSRKYRDYFQDTLLIYQLQKLESYSNSANAVIATMRRKPLDTSLIKSQLASMSQRIEIAGLGVFDSVRLHHNLRNLHSAKALILNISERLSSMQAEVDKKAFETIEQQVLLRSISKDSLMWQIPEDTQLGAEYTERLREIFAKVGPAYTQLVQQQKTINVLQNSLLKLNLRATDDLGAINNILNTYYAKLLSPEFSYLWQPTQRHFSASDILLLSGQKGKVLVLTYLQNSWNIRFLEITLLLFLLITIAWCKSILVTQNLTSEIKLAGRLLQSPVLSAFFIAATFSPFLHPEAPMLYREFLWVLSTLLGTIISWQYIPPHWRNLWVVMIGLFACAALDNLLLQASRTERWFILFLSVAGIVVSVMGIQQINRKVLPVGAVIKLFIYLFILQMAVSSVANIFGRFTLAKVMLTGGYFNFVLAIVLYWLSKLLADLVYVAIECNRNNKHLTPFFNFTKIDEGTRPVLKLGMGLLWAIVFLQNLNLYDWLVSGTTDVLVKQRSIGSFTYSLSSIAIFFTVIYIASLLTKVVSFLLAGDKDQKLTASKNRFGGTIIIFKLVILSAGFLLAIAAAGIPTDRITIILGALGVGVGFGLQNIVSNLMSGIIIAFEKPFNIGDQIEVGDKLGMVTEIGIRSSKLATFDGAEVIIPNGDLLSQHLVNWTLSTNQRRIEVMVGVKYGTDLKMTIQLLEGILNDFPNILKYPAPMVLAHEFGNSSIVFRLLFWVGDVGDWLRLKSEVIEKVDQQFKDHGIEIPYPQQDLYIKEMPATLNKEVVEKPSDNEPPADENENSLSGDRRQPKPR